MHVLHNFGGLGYKKIAMALDEVIFEDEIILKKNY